MVLGKEARWVGRKPEELMGSVLPETTESRLGRRRKGKLLLSRLNKDLD